MEKQSVDLQAFKERLLAEQRRFEEQVENLNKWSLDEMMSDSYGETSMVDNHPGDAGTEMFERSKDVGLRARALATLADIKGALERIDAGTYTRCRVCGGPIALERLEAQPWTERCIACAEALAAQRNPNPRPVEEELLSPPFARTWLDDADYTGFDGEDAWQAVALYGTAETPQDVIGAHDYQDIAYQNEPQGRVEEIEGLVDEGGEPLQ